MPNANYRKGSRPERRKSKTITVAELDWMFANEFVISSVWISPVEGVEYRLKKIGHRETLKYCKSERACYNAAVRISKKEQE